MFLETFPEPNSIGGHGHHYQKDHGRHAENKGRVPVQSGPVDLLKQWSEKAHQCLDAPNPSKDLKMKL